MFLITATQKANNGTGVGALNLQMFFPEYEASPKQFGILVPSLYEAEAVANSLGRVTREKGIKATIQAV